MDQIVWGIIGCGNVTEVKSGPAFNKVPNSSLDAVMRRDKTLAEDYAKRHHINKWYSDADALINDQDINAIYIATPPDSHEQYTIAAFKAGKPVYVEKPMALNSSEAQRMLEASEEYSCKLSIAHYRRAQPRFLEIRRLIQNNTLGDILSAEIKLFQAPTPGVADSWRVNPLISGGGLFHDLAPHQLDLMLYFFGKPISVSGSSSNRGKNYQADDYVTADIIFGNHVPFNGIWDYTVTTDMECDLCEIKGTKGILQFPIFTDGCRLTLEGQTTDLHFPPIQHVQQPMIEQVVNYFLDKGPNPCSASEALIVMEMMDRVTGKLK
ncbi:MAG: Gfo/Idh/MocA family oxidoreductase [Daejeonella sp.]|uniref:Gfo/Idh/MocA family protein n=1 Tax=Daejeonella sp. TaxID=2805397 RepID=UPI002733A173|nr:Gfo/Idh/MocA family oxidoreductase [Daejeonella sp.]MDP3468886.1 Gfo/Idh/MocA family oxidoreductase [Daejeonella sp.]